MIFKEEQIPPLDWIWRKDTYLAVVDGMSMDREHTIVTIREVLKDSSIFKTIFEVEAVSKKILGVHHSRYKTMGEAVTAVKNEVIRYNRKIKISKIIAELNIKE